MDRTERLGLLLALPGLGLALAIGGLFAFTALVCDPLYEPNRLLDFEFLQQVGPSVARELGGPREPPPRPDLDIHRAFGISQSCYGTP